MTRALFPALAAFTLALALLSLLTGPAGFGIGESLRALVSGEGEAVTLVMREIRLPRVILAIMVGASLGLSGAAMISNSSEIWPVSLRATSVATLANPARVRISCARPLSPME
jgi:ABC-type enterobactin transport system permease subunit